MSSPDNIIKLKSTIDLYEKELIELIKEFEKRAEIDPTTLDPNRTSGLWMSTYMDERKILNKLIIAYREYVNAIEPLLPTP